jgi:hypothetical protein
VSCERGFSGSNTLHTSNVSFVTLGKVNWNWCVLLIYLLENLSRTWMRSVQELWCRGGSLGVDQLLLTRLSISQASRCACILGGVSSGLGCSGRTWQSPQMCRRRLTSFLRNVARN